MRNRKGQMIFEFIIASVLFFIILLSVLTSVNLQAGQYAAATAASGSEAAAIRISEQLRTSAGVWDFSAPSVRSIGFAKSAGVLEQRKLDTFVGICGTSYPLVLSLLDPGQQTYASTHVKILVTNSTTTIVDCGPAVSAEKPGFAERVALQENGALAKILVWVW